MGKWTNISNSKRSILCVMIILIMVVTFEALQQLFYINRYNLREGVTFFDVLKAQSMSWLIWLIFTFPLVKFSHKTAKKSHSNFSTFIKSFALIIGLTMLSIFIVSVVQLLQSGASFSSGFLVSEFIPFFIYQKALILALGYTAITVIMYYFFANEQLLITVEELSAVKKSHLELYTKLSEQIDDKATVLNIKIGNKRKLIPVDHIYWIEADDYCVKVHTKDHTYTMRSSLKSLERKLDSNFLRVHRKAIANMTRVKELNLNKSPYVILENNTEVPVSKSNLKLVRNFIS